MSLPSAEAQAPSAPVNAHVVVAAPPTRRWWSGIAHGALRLAITMALTVVLVMRVNIMQAAGVLQHLALPFALGACGLMIVVGACSVLRWRLLLQALAVMPSLLTIIRLTAISIPWNLVIPGGESGTLVRAALLARQHPTVKGKIWASIIVEHLLLIVAELSVGGGALLLARYPPPQVALWLIMLGAGIASMIGLTLLFLLPIASARLDSGVARASHALVIPTKLRHGWKSISGAAAQPDAAGEQSGEWLAPLWQGLTCYRGHSGALLKSLVVALGYYAVLYAAYWLVAQGLGIPLGYADIVWLVALAGIITHLPITIAGVGVREGILLFFLTQRGVGPSTALAFALAILALNLALSLPGLCLQAARAFRRA
jgi:uncharacterized membrane protein YbhN (UPF0104 family)